ncbi:MAG: hypothetical protein MHMPM18_003453 [Marteilia pararefringens]
MTENKPLKAIIAGGITGGVEICITYPTEYVKTQLQLSHKGLATVNYNGLLDCISQTFAKGGIAGFYRGLSVLLYGSIPKSAVRFSSFEYAKQKSEIDGKFSNQSKLLSGLFAGFCEAVLVVTPMETLKVKFIADQNQKIPKYKGFFSGCATILSNEGISQVYKGLFPTILKQGTNQMVRFFVMENLKDLYKERKRQKNGGDEFIYIPKLWIGLFGGTAGAASVLFNTPVDVVKTKMQVIGI